MRDFLFRGSLEALDPELHDLAEVEAERQYRKLILIPSESSAPLAVRELLASAFQNIYAEGYPDEASRGMSEAEILDHSERLAHYRRYSDPRYYKGVEYADTVEALARRRCAEAFAANGVSAGDLYVNVQALSGAPANNAVYHALVEPGGTILGMNLLHGGHLTHGSSVNRSGKFYKAIHYTVDPETERLDYDRALALAEEHKPRIVIAGYSSYPWAVDWERFREIADAAGGYLLADIAHVAGMVAAGAYPSPVGYADVITFTTHKTLCGPRGAAILTTSPALAKKIDRAVFPGEQGGPHINTVAAQALTFKLAQTDEFHELQHQIVANCVALSAAIEAEGLRIPFGGTDTHLTNVDCHSVRGRDGTPLSGDMAARILDLAGIVVNRNTIPGDKSARNPAGIRLGTPWVTQRGFDEEACRKLGGLIARILMACRPHAYPKRANPLQRAKIDFEALNEARIEVRDLAAEAGIDFEPSEHGYPHFYYLDDAPPEGEQGTIELSGANAEALIRWVTPVRPSALGPGESVEAVIHAAGTGIDAIVTRPEGEAAWTVTARSEAIPRLLTWLRDLSDGFVTLDEDDLQRKAPGPVVVRLGAPGAKPPTASRRHEGADKPWFVGAEPDGGEPLSAFEWDQEKTRPIRRTALFETHKDLGAKMTPFAGWEMPLWYSSVIEEHRAVRQTAGLFDVSHMGVFQVDGPDAAVFLDCVAANDVGGLAEDSSLYTHLLDPDGRVLDDVMIYRTGPHAYMLVVNAANDEKDWAWLQAVRDGRVCIDSDRPAARAYGADSRLLDLHAPEAGDAARVDLALQGPASREILLGLGCDAETSAALKKLPWAGVLQGEFGGFDLIVSRTGYTGERTAYELFVHPESSVALWAALMSAGEIHGLRPAGLGARDSLRNEAGLPLYGQELAGDLGLGVADAGFSGYVKSYKPWFIGRSAFLRQDSQRQSEVARFRFDEKAIRMAHYGDPVVDGRGKVIGLVTSCTVGQDGYLVGQAYLSARYLDEGTHIGVFQGMAGEPFPDGGALALGDRVTVPTPATVLSRFSR